VEVGVCHHSSLGGFKIDENAETTLPHLYAAGETAAGPHGADRMGDICFSCPRFLERGLEDTVQLMPRVEATYR